MSDILTYFYLLPLGIVVAILATSAGISGSNFWIPIYILLLGIDPKTSFWLALLTMLFGFGSGVVKNVMQTTINWSIAKQYLKIATGTGKIIMPCVLKHCKIRSPAEAVGTTVFIIFVVNLFAAVFRLTPDFISVLSEQQNLILTIMLWVIPGVIIGGQLGPVVARKLSERSIRFYVGILLVFVGLLIYLRTYSG
jgi:uncharacterized membrane protein YfcA